MSKLDVMPLISIIVPVYNAEKYLTECIDSVLAQSYKNIELILVDDGSRDLSGEICDTYESNYNNVYTYHIENNGAANARNIGIEKAQGQYITFWTLMIGLILIFVIIYIVELLRIMRIFLSASYGIVM